MTNVPVAIVERMIDASLCANFDTDCKQTADAARALQGAGEIEPPQPCLLEGDARGCASCVNGSADFGDGIPAIIEPVGAGASDGLCDATSK